MPNSPCFTGKTVAWVVDWVFFPKPGEWDGRVILPYIQTDSGQGRTIRDGLRQVDLRKSAMRFVTDARETRGHYQSHKKQQDKTKTSNAAITDAAMQIALATQSVHAEERKWAQDRSSDQSRTPPLPPLHPNTTIVPLIVTTAELLICDFNATDVDGDTGEIPFGKSALSPVPRVLYEFPLPHHLHTFHWNETEMGIRRHIIIVHSSQFADFLENHTVDLVPPERRW